MKFLKSTLAASIVAASSVSAFAATEPQRVQVTGEIMDTWCYYSGVMGGRCLLYTSPSPRDLSTSRMPSSA